MNSQANLQPGPINPELLFLHRDHRAFHLFYGGLGEGKLLARRCDNNFWKLVPNIPDRVMTHIEGAGFGGVIRLGHIQLDHSLITALVERWRSETHTFHFPIGEATVTLQDVQVLLGLNVEGSVVSGRDKKPDEGWHPFCQDMMGVTLEPSSIKKGAILLSTLHDILKMRLPYNASEEDCIKRARIYIMHLIGGFLLADSSSSSVNLYHLYNLSDFVVLQYMAARQSYSPMFHKEPQWLSSYLAMPWHGIYQHSISPLCLLEHAWSGKQYLVELSEGCVKQ